jgi:hypothetical protein
MPLLAPRASMASASEFLIDCAILVRSDQIGFASTTVLLQLNRESRRKMPFTGHEILT